MGNNRTVSLTISLPKECRATLRKLAAECTMDNPDQVVTAAGLVREIVVHYLKTDIKQADSSSKGETNDNKC